MADKFAQELRIHLKGGQTVTVAFKAEKPDTLNPQIDAFFKAVSDKSKKEDNFLFQGQVLVLIRISDVSCAEVRTGVVKDNQPQNTSS